MKSGSRGRRCATCAVALVAAAVPAVVTAQAGPDTIVYGLVVRQERDTIAFERVTESPTIDGGRTTRAEVIVPNRARLLVTAGAGADGCPTHTDVRVFPWGAAPDATPLQHVEIRLDEDSVRIHVMARGVEQRVVRPAMGARTIIAQASEATAATVAACARHLMRVANQAATDTLTLPALVFPNLRLERLGVRRHGDTLTVVVGRDTSFALLDPAGTVRVSHSRGGRVVVRRVPIRAVEAISIAAPDYAAPPDAPYVAHDVSIPVDEPTTPGTIELAGTLTIPRSAARPVPAVVLISGSGAQDRDSYAAIADGWRPFRQLADTLGRRGIAVLRIDDRGVGGSSGDHGTSTERTTTYDIRAALRLLRTLPSIDPLRLGILGHSEGARVAMMVAAEEQELAGIVLLAGAADPRAAILAQALWQADHDPRIQVPRDSVRARVSQQFDSLARTSDRAVYHWDAPSLARSIRAPVAIFHGATDRQVPADQADSLSAVFRNAGQRDVTVRVFEGRNHLFLRDPDGDFLSYDRLTSGRVDGEVLGAITDWIVARLGRP